MNTIVDSITGAGWRQHQRLLVLRTVLGADALLAETATIHESLGPLSAHAGFRIELSVLARDANHALTALIGQPARLDLQTSHSRSVLRPFHGHITHASRLGANGGFARYRLVIEPWLAFLGGRRDSFVFQDKTVFEIVDHVFARWQGQGRLVPAWRWDIEDPTVFPKRSLTTQYKETDLAFLRRLLVEEGLFCWFEHGGEAEDGESLGTHTLVIADHNAAFADNTQRTFRFTQPGATLAEDSLDAWRGTTTLDTTTRRSASWDYRANASAELAAGATKEIALNADDDAGQYAWTRRTHGERLQGARQQALDVRRTRYHAEGTVRTAAPGSVFVLADHDGHAHETEAERRFAIVAVEHRARNNLAETVPDAIAALGEAMADGGLKAALQNATTTTVEPALAGQQRNESVDLYSNRLTLHRAQHAWRPITHDAHGRHLHPRPTAHGTLTAVVVGAAGAPTHTDRDLRVRVQFPWQRGANAASGQPHPSGEDNAPASDALGTWLRVLTPVAGANWGGHFTPRPGQEVVVGFLHGDIDRPVIVGAVYNGEGNADAPGNRIAEGGMKASANAPALFAGASDEAHTHSASLSGIKSQQLSASRSGQGGFNRLIFDDTPGEARIELGTTAYASTLQLGHLKQQHDNARRNDRGHGAEFSTRAFGALRAGSGLLISADERAGARAAHLDSREPVNQSEEAKSLTDALAQVAAKHNAALAGEATTLPVSEGLEAAIETLSATESNVDSGLKPALQKTDTDGATNNNSSPVGPTSAGQTNAADTFKQTARGTGTVTAWATPRLQFAAPGGIAQLTAVSAILAAGKTLGLAAAHDIAFVAQQNHRLAVKGGIALFTVGKASGNKPNTETGIHLHAASGKVSAQAQSGPIRAAADKRVTLASTDASLSASASKYLLATAKGAYLRIEGGNIELHAPGQVRLKASQKNLTGPKSSRVGSSLPKPGAIEACAAALAQAAASGSSVI